MTVASLSRPSKRHIKASSDIHLSFFLSFENEEVRSILGFKGINDSAHDIFILDTNQTSLSKNTKVITQST